MIAIKRKRRRRTGERFLKVQSMAYLSQLTQESMWQNLNGKHRRLEKMGEPLWLCPWVMKIIGLVVLKDNLKENIRQNLDEVRSTGITTVMITGDNQVTAQVIAKEAGVDEIMAEAKPADKLKRVVEEQEKGHIIGMMGDGTNDAPGISKG